MGLSWKMFIGPALLLGMKVAKFDYDLPQSLLIIRILYGVSQVAMFAVMALIYTRISAEGDDKKTLKVKAASPM